MPPLYGRAVSFLAKKDYGLRSGRKVVFALVALGCATFGLPYLFPMTPSISLSYDAGFNNRVAVVIFVLGSLLFAYFLRTDLQIETEDRPLGRAALYWGWGITLAMCVVRPGFTANVIVGSEGPYFVNRQYLLSTGLIPYRQFEFAYGPLMLYPEVWISRLLHVSLMTGYFLWWTAWWLLGVWMLWELVGSIDIVTRYRTQIFALVMVIGLPATAQDGLNYTIGRCFFGAYIVLLVYRICWRWSRPAWTSVAAVVGVALALGCSPEQGVGVSAGLVLYFGYLIVRKSPVFSRTALLGMLLGIAAVFLVANHFAMFTTMRSFASGGNSLPILPTTNVCLLLGAYVCAACMLMIRLREGAEMSVTLPLVGAGAALLPSAMGRCDTGHLESAWPAMLVGIFAIYAFASVRRWWVPIILVVFVIPGVVKGAIYEGRTARDAVDFLLISHGGTPTALQRFVRTRLVRSPSRQRQMDEKSAELEFRWGWDHPWVPCDRKYLAPSYSEIMGPCVDSGYYLGSDLAFLPSQVQQKIDELAAHPNMPLLMAGRAVGDGFTIRDNMGLLYELENTFFLPPQRNASVTFEPLMRYISDHYVLTKTLDKGEMSVWEPKGGGGVATGGAPSR